jgi:non-heme chloroperoxidase
VPCINVREQSWAPVELYYEDHGAGAPVVLIEGSPLSSRAQDRQVPMLQRAAHRVITYERRAFGRPSRKQPL